MFEIRTRNRRCVLMSVKAEEWIELHPIRTMDDTFKTFAKDDGRKFVLEPV